MKISEEEKNRILELHKNALLEQSSGFGGGSFGGGGARGGWENDILYLPDDIKKPESDDSSETNVEDKNNTQKNKIKRQSWINKIWCSVVNGLVTVEYKNMKWDDFVKHLQVTQQEIEIAKKSCPQKKKITWQKESWPLRFMMSGPFTQRLQEKLMVKNTGNFYTLTEKAVARKMDMLGMKYNRKTGISKEDYDKIMNSKTEIVLTPIEKKDISVPSANVKMPSSISNIAQKQTPKELYDYLVSKGIIFSDGNRIKLKTFINTESGRQNFNLNQEQYDMINGHLTSMGYKNIKTKDKSYGVKYVWEKMA